MYPINFVLGEKAKIPYTSKQVPLSKNCLGEKWKFPIFFFPNVARDLDSNLEIEEYT